MDVDWEDWVDGVHVPFEDEKLKIIDVEKLAFAATALLRQIGDGEALSDDDRKVAAHTARGMRKILTTFGYLNSAFGEQYVVYDLADNFATRPGDKE